MPPKHKSVDDMLSDAKSTLAKANAFTKSVEGRLPSMFAPPAKATPQPAKPQTGTPSTGLAGEAASAGQGIKDRMDMSAKAMGKFHKGGTVPKTGTYKLLAGEKVIMKNAPKDADAGLSGPSAPEAPKKPKVAKHGFTATHIEHHADGSHTVHHIHSEGPHKDVKHAVPDLDALHDSMEENLGEPEDGEEEAEAGKWADERSDKEALPKGAAKPAAGVEEA